MVVPVDFPTGYNVADPHLARMIGLDELKHWELAPANAALLHDAGVPIAFTAHGLRILGRFFPGFERRWKLDFQSWKPFEL